jgi:hypothetical protein
MKEHRTMSVKSALPAVNVCWAAFISLLSIIGFPSIVRSLSIIQSKAFLGLLCTLISKENTMRWVEIRNVLRAIASFWLAMAAIPLLVTYSFGGSGTLTASGNQLGVTSQYLGANEGSSQFNINDLVDLGINTYRIYGGMSRWEPTNAESTYGSPSIAQIEADPNVINWAFYDNIFTNPPGGSDYSWSASTGIPPVSAATIISDLNAHNITPIIVLRNRDNNGNPAWSPNPPVTAADWNVWFEHVFATVYWFNVRHTYVVDNWEVHNEPNNSGQGWGGTESRLYSTICG